MTTSNSTIRAIVEEGFGYLAEQNLEPFFELYDEKLYNASLALMGLPTTKEGFKLFVSGFYASFSNAQFLPQTVVCEGDTTMFRWVFKGVHTADFNGIPPTGKAVEISAFTTFKLGPNGKIIEQYDLADLATLLRQLGVMPS
jgi:steroid delta-isomerase-like uncharacterized protein